MNTTGPGSVITERDVDIRALQVTGERGQLMARLYSCGTSNVKRESLIVFFHGGEFVRGNLADADEFLRRLVLSNPEQLVLATSYTLAHVRPFPAAVEDAYAVLLWTRKSKAKLGWSGKNLLVAGIEAGANLAAVCSLVARDRGRSGPVLAGQILIMPMLDASLTSGSMRRVSLCPILTNVTDRCAKGYREYLRNPIDRIHPYASPVQANRLKNLPPALIISAETDPLCDEAEQYASKLLFHGTKATLRRLPVTRMLRPGDRVEFASKRNCQVEITLFLAALATATQY